MMRCAEVRDRLIDSEPRKAHAAGTIEIGRHLDGCEECRVFADRLVSLRAGLRSHLTRVDPGSGFATRVTGELPAAADPFAWAALRVLPATLALALVLAGWALLAPPPAELLADTPSDDPVSWVLADDTMVDGRTPVGDGR